MRSVVGACPGRAAIGGCDRNRPSDERGPGNNEPETGEVIRNGEEEGWKEEGREEGWSQEEEVDPTLLDLARPRGIGRQHLPTSPRFHIPAADRETRLQKRESCAQR